MNDENVLNINTLLSSKNNFDNDNSIKRSLSNEISNSLSKLKKSRRSTFEGGTAALNDLLDSSILSNNSDSLSSYKKNDRRQTVDQNDINYLLNNLSTDNDDSIDLFETTEQISKSKRLLTPTIAPSPLRRSSRLSNSNSMNLLSISPASSKRKLNSRKSNSNDGLANKRDSFASFDFISPINNRRTTADQSDLAQLILNLEDNSPIQSCLSVYSVQSTNHESGNTFNSFTSPLDNRRTTVNGDDINNLMNHLEDDSLSYQSIKITQSPSNRRMTANQADMQELLLDLNTSNSNFNEVNTRRFTADSTDLANLIDLIETDDNSSQNNDIKQSDDNIDSSLDESTNSFNSSHDLTINRFLRSPVSLDDTQQSLYGLINQPTDNKPNIYESPINKPPNKPSEMLIPTSILKSSNKSNYFNKGMNNSTITKRSVIFGSPDAMEFNKYSPTTNYTPIDKQRVRINYLSNSKLDADNNISALDPITQENSDILDEWDRLTNDTGSDSDDDIDLPFHNPNLLTDSVNSSKSKKRRQSINSNSSKLSKRRKSTIHSHIQQSNDTMKEINESDHTISLPNNLIDYMEQNENEDDESHNISYDDNTHPLEADLQSLIRHIDYTQHSIIVDTTSDKSLASDSSIHLSSDHRLINDNNIEVSREDMNQSIISLIDHSDTMNTSNQSSKNNSLLDFLPEYKENEESEVETSHTIQLEEQLGDLLDLYSNTTNDVIDCDDHTQKLEPNLTTLVERLTNDCCNDSIINKSIVSVNEATDTNKSVEESDHTINVDDDLIEDGSIDEIDQVEANDDADINTSYVIDSSNNLPSSDIITNRVNRQISYNTNTHIYEDLPFNKPLDDPIDNSNKKSNELLNKLKAINSSNRQTTLNLCSQTPMPSHKGKSILYANYLLTQPMKSAKKLLDRSINIEEEKLVSKFETVSIDKWINSYDVSTYTYVNNSITNYFINNPTSSSSDISNLMSQAIFEVSDQISIFPNQITTHIDKPIDLLDHKSFCNDICEQCKQLVDFNWLLFENKLFDIMIDLLDNEIAAIKLDYDNLSTRNNNAENELLQLIDNNNGLMYDDIDSWVINSKQLVHQERDSYIKNNKLYAEIKNQNNYLYKLVDIYNKITYCYLTTYTSNNINLSIKLTSTFAINIHFNLSNNGDGLVVSDINVDIANKSLKTNIDDSLANIYFVMLLVNDNNGCLNSNYLSNIVNLTDIPPLIHKISGLVSLYKKITSSIHSYIHLHDDMSCNVQGSTVVFTSNSSSYIKQLSINQLVLMDGNIQDI